METALRHIGNFISTGDGSANVYLHAVDEHLNMSSSLSDLIHLLDTTNFLLSKAKTRMFGLQILDKVLPWVNHDLLEQKMQLWITFILKACNQDELRKYGSLIYKSLRTIAIILRQHSDLSKNFASNHLSKVYEIITQSPDDCSSDALQCAEVYLSTYPKLSCQSREILENFLKKFPDTFDDDLNHYVGKCLHYIQQTTVPGNKDLKPKEQWKMYRNWLIENLSVLLNEAFSENEKSSNAESDNGAKMIIEPLTLSTEPNVRAAQLFVRFHNLSKYLRITLCEPQINAVCKPIAPKNILNLISRGLSVTCTALNNEATYSKKAFGVFLPKIQLDLLEICKTFIRTLHCNLRSHYKSLLGCLIHVLKSTSSKNSVRTEVYNVIALWCETLAEGSRCEIYADELVSELFKDISPVKNELISQIQTKEKQNKKNHNPLKKTTKYLSSALDENCKALYLASVRCLQIFLRFCSCFLKPSTMVTIQMNVLKICASFNVVKQNEAYHNWKMRLEMYKLLHTILITPNQYSPPPTQIIIYILRTAQCTTSNTEMRSICTKMIEDIEKILHPQKESLIIPIEERDIRNAFIKIGQETLLERWHAGISNLRYCQDIEISEQVSKNVVREDLAVEAAITIEDNEYTCKNASNPTEDKENTEDEKDTSKIYFKSHQVLQNSIKNNTLKNRTEMAEIDEAEILKAPNSKKPKMIQDYDIIQDSPVTHSDDSNMEVEILKPLHVVEKRVNGKSDISTDKLTRNDQQDTSIEFKDDGNELSELEACFVDELKENV